MSPRTESPGSAADPPAPPPRIGESTHDAPVVPDIAADDRDGGWGDRDDGRRSDEWYRRERPPHHG